MNINRRAVPGMKVRRFHNGGKGPGHPHGKITTAKLDSILSSSVENAVFQFSQFRDLVGTHEGGIGSYTSHQDGGGPGRGKYQFDEASAQTAYNRLETIGKDRGYEIPILTSEDFKNMDKVSPEIQDLMFTANFAKSPDTSVATVLTDKSQWDNQWLDGHWRGKAEDREARRTSFKHTQENMPDLEVKDKNSNSAFLPMFPDETMFPNETISPDEPISPDENFIQFIHKEF